jgi:hypothetical protein
MKQVEQYLSPNHVNTLHERAFTETFNVIVDFVNQSATHRDIAWVCNSAPGHGKTSALTALCNMILHEKYDIALLLVFNNTKTMDSLYKQVNDYATQHNFTNAIQCVESDNVSDVVADLRMYRIVCMTQQRFANIAVLEPDSFKVFEHYCLVDDYGDKQCIKRLIIIDEMPQFTNEAIFDVGKENNCVDWFDEMVKNIDNENMDSSVVRALISSLVSEELSQNTSGTSYKLIRRIQGTEDEKRLQKVMDNLENVKGVTPESLKRYKWFKRLLNEDSVGAIFQNKLLCAEWIDYRKFGNILVLDGTAHITSLLYDRGGFELKKVTNYHDYNSRLFIKFKNINTSARSRQKKDKIVHDTIAADIGKIRDKVEQKNNRLIALPIKSDIRKYRNNGVITDEQYEKFFKTVSNDDDDENMALHLLNVVGLNDLADYDIMALLSMPIRQPSAYLLKAISIYSPNININIINCQGIGRKKVYDRWFEDERVQRVFEQMVLAELVQIIHRTSLRKLNETGKVVILIYTNRMEWMDKIRSVFGLGDDNVRFVDLQADERIKDIAAEWAVKVHAELVKRGYGSHTANKLCGKPFSRFISYHWKEHANIINEVFWSHGIRIVNNGTKYHKFQLL